MNEFLKVITIFAVCSSLGWFLEFLFRSYNHKKLMNPGFLAGMSLPLYGTGGIMLYLSSKLFVDMNLIPKIIIVFFFSAIFMTVIEFIAGIILLKYYKVRLWDYSKMKYNYKGILSLVFSITWGVISCIYLLFLQKYIVMFASSIISDKFSLILLGIYYLLFTIDLFISMNILQKLKNFAKELKVILVVKNVFEDMMKIIDKKGVFKKIWLFLEPKSFINRYIKIIYSKRINHDYWKENEKLINSIIKRRKYLKLQKYYAHKNISCYEHSIDVCKESLKFVSKNNIKCDIESLIVGSLLHDYYLYDWHKGKKFTFHGLKHHRIALNNARKDYKINWRISNIIYSHMFPLTFWAIPLCKEALIVTTFDKVVAMKDLKRSK